MTTAAQTVLEPTARVRAQKGQQQTWSTPGTRATTGRSQAPQASRTPQERTEETHPDGAGLHLRTRTFRPPVPIPYLSREELPARDLAFYGGLGVLTVAGALEWPVALAIGGATWLLRGKRKEQH
ncbi:hypothetical protein ABZX30_21210 [Streptomyces sp. NPDC004542]|uniref:hypothetical protein n=1 Tax=Streptomyces sp. NPDC004542 TaxID=3154281 RepID=UPI0033A4AF0B